MLEKKNSAPGHASIGAYLDASIRILEESVVAFGDDRVERAVGLIAESLKCDLPLMVCGNGGSASDAQHITGELVGRFLKERRALNAICLSANTSVLTAWANDYDYADVFARQVETHGTRGGVLLALSTSGNSINVVRAAQAAKRMNVPVIAMTGRGGGEVARTADVLLDVPTTSTPLIQQVHICLYHYVCERVEALLV